MVLDPDTPIYNTIIFYILIVCTLLIIRPKFMYCRKSKRFKSFGFGKNQTLLAFPFISISSGIILYMIFLWISILYSFLNKKTLKV